MRRVVRSQIMGSAALCLLSVPLVRSLRAMPSALPAGVRPRLVPAARGPFEAALGEARRFWTQAKIAANEERGALETWDPAGTAGLDAETWRRGVLRTDRGGYLREALAAARRAAGLARTSDDTWRAAEMRVLLAYGAGDDAAGLRQARLLVALRPRSARSWRVLRCAAQRAGPHPPLGAQPPQRALTPQPPLPTTGRGGADTRPDRVSPLPVVGRGAGGEGQDCVSQTAK